MNAAVVNAFRFWYWNRQKTANKNTHSPCFIANPLLPQLTHTAYLLLPRFPPIGKIIAFIRAKYIWLWFSCNSVKIFSFIIQQKYSYITLNLQLAKAFKGAYTFVYSSVPILIWETITDLTIKWNRLMSGSLMIPFVSQHFLAPAKHLFVLSFVIRHKHKWHIPSVAFFYIIFCM